MAANPPMVVTSDYRDKVFRETRTRGLGSEMSEIGRTPTRSVWARRRDSEFDLAESHCRLRLSVTLSKQFRALYRTTRTSAR